MNVYMIGFIIVWFFSLLSWFEEEKLLDVIYGYVVIFILLFFSGARYQVGWDWEGYTDNFDNFIFNLKESGYSLIVYLIKLMGGNIQIVFYIMAILTIILFYYSSKKFNVSVYLFSALYFSKLFFIQNMNVMRQGLAISIIFFSLKYIEEKMFKKYLFFVFLASTFHISALIFVPFYFLLRRKYSSIEKMLLIFGGVFIMTSSFITWSIEFMGNIGILKGYILERLQTYLSLEQYSGSNVFQLFYLKGFFILLCLGYIKNRKEEDTKLNMVYNLYLYFILSKMYFSEISIFQERLSYYFILGEILTWCYLFKEVKRKDVKILIFLLAFAFSFKDFNSMILGVNKEKFIPYKNYIIEYIKK